MSNSPCMVMFSAWYEKMLMTSVQHKCMCRGIWESLSTQLGSSPVSPFRSGVVLDLIVHFQLNPLRNWTILLFLGQESFDPGVQEEKFRNRVNHTHRDDLEKKRTLPPILNSCEFRNIRSLQERCEKRKIYSEWLDAVSR